MTKEEFMIQMFKWVVYHKEKLEQIDLRKARLPEEVVGASCHMKYNPFLELDEKYFNIRILSNLQGLYSVICENPDLNVYQVKMFIISNTEFKALNRIMNYNPYFVEELKDKTNSPLDIAIAYARWNQLNDKFKNMPKR